MSEDRGLQIREQGQAKYDTPYILRSRATGSLGEQPRPLGSHWTAGLLASGALGCVAAWEALTGLGVTRGEWC
jgi:hypothetical protein